ncbi:MAG TPA: hypothetical protein VNT26_20035, partial [Candidatus Sulfotelmatobacter sp.]|nr:hypothetical protein [Candidatus Sulfotelmatobacter sp.]
TDGDRFLFAYSTDNVTFQTLGEVEATADNNLYQAFALPNTLQGTVYVRVRDTDRTVGNVALDSLFIDHMLIRTDVSPVLGPPAAPQLQTATVEQGSVTLTWSASSGASACNVYRQSGAEATFVQIAAGVTGTTYTDSGLADGTYQYRVTATNNYGESEPSSVLSATAQAPLPTQAPTNLAAVAAKRKISLTWTQSGSAGVTRNRIYRSATPDGSYTLLNDIPASTAYSDAVPSGATYYYVVTAIANGLESPYSPSASATVK